MESLRCLRLRINKSFVTQIVQYPTKQGVRFTYSASLQASSPCWVESEANLTGRQRACLPPRAHHASLLAGYHKPNGMIFEQNKKKVSNVFKKHTFQLYNPSWVLRKIQCVLKTFDTFLYFVGISSHQLTQYKGHASLTVFPFTIHLTYSKSPNLRKHDWTYKITVEPQ